MEFAWGEREAGIGDRVDGCAVALRAGVGWEDSVNRRLPLSHMCIHCVSTCGQTYSAVSSTRHRI